MITFTITFYAGLVAVFEGNEYRISQYESDWWAKKGKPDGNQIQGNRIKYEVHPWFLKDAPKDIFLAKVVRDYFVNQLNGN